MSELIREMIDAAYDTGHYAGDGRSGTDLHKDRISDREALRDKLETRLIAADVLAVEAQQAESLLMQLAPLVYKPEIQEHLPYGLADVVKTWVRSSKFDTALQRYLEATDA